jgi:ABC-type cobalamin/Fe3+-siderophores transport system ATPase subunit
MKIKRLHLERFRQFEDTTFEFGDTNLLVGPNNCGKTSVLHAIRAFFLLMHGHVRFEGDPPKAGYHKRYLTSAEEVAPAPDLRELWHKQQAGKPLKISVTFENDVLFAAVLRQQFGQIHVSAEDLPSGLTAKNVTRYLGSTVAFIPGLVGVLVEEPFATAARRNALATQGRYSEIFRSSLHQLKERDGKAIEKINQWLDELFNVEVSSISFNMEKDEFVTIKYKQGNVEYDVVSSGSGLQQIIQVMTYLYLTKPKVLLIDEPDAHLHSRLQARLGELFRRVATDLGAQLFVSTHSLDLVNTFNTDQVIVVDSGKREVKAIGSNADLVEAFVDAGVVDVSSLSRILASRSLVVIEDKDQTILKAIDKAIGGPLFSSKSSCYVLSSNGVSNFRAVADLGKVLSSLTRAQFHVVFIQDRDGMPDFVVDKFSESQKRDGVSARLLQRHEIESYLIEPKLIEAVAKRAGRKVTAKTAEDAILKAAQNLKAVARGMSRKTAVDINRHLDAAKKWKKDGELEVETDKWFDGLDLTSLDVVRTVFPGKELLQEALKILNTRAGKGVTRSQLIAALGEGFIAEDIKKMLKEVAVPYDDRA